MARTIVLGYDGSECANEALDAAVDLARGQPGSRIVVVHGCEVNLSVGGGPMAAELIVPELQDVDPPAEAGIRRLLDEAAASIAAAGVAVESMLEWKTASAALLDVAKKEGADMIVVGSHGTGAIRGVLLGSTPYKLLHHSHVPVLVVPHRH
jgi:nucleotide-binding universal stress UspA family protein